MHYPECSLLLFDDFHSMLLSSLLFLHTLNINLCQFNLGPQIYTQNEEHKAPGGVTPTALLLRPPEVVTVCPGGTPHYPSLHQVGLCMMPKLVLHCPQKCQFSTRSHTKSPDGNTEKGLCKIRS